MQKDRYREVARNALHRSNGALGSHDPGKLLSAIKELQGVVKASMRMVDHPDSDAPGREARTIRAMIVQTATVLVAVAGLFLWGYSEIGKQIDKVESSLGRRIDETKSDIGSLTTQLVSFKDETYRRTADLQADVSAIAARLSVETASKARGR